MINHRDYIRRRAILFGTLSPLKASQKILKDLDAYSVLRYGTTIYEQAYNYYQVKFKTQLPEKLFYAIIIIIPLPMLFLVRNLFTEVIAGVYYTAIAYKLRKDGKDV